MPDPAAYQRFFVELKRRHVFRVMAVYGVVGFGILEAVDLLLPALLLPEWTYRLIALIVLIGFPIALVLAWAFELTPSGLQRTERASATDLMAVDASSRWPAAVAALAGAVLLGLGAWWGLTRDPSSTEVRSYDSIAVLPFTDMTGNDEYLGDGLAEELLNALAGIEGLKVASRTSSFSFKGSTADIRTIGDSLDAAVVLEGSVRASGDRFRITAQLIDSRDGYHLWSKTYDRPRSDLLDLQDELTEEIVASLRVELGAGGAAALLGRGTVDPEAYDLYLQGRHFWNKRTEDDLAVAIGLFEEAIEVDSTYAPAYAAIADAYVVPAGWDEDPGPSLDEGERHARRALELDPTLAQAHAALAMALMMRDLDFAAAEAGFSRAIELDPGYATAHQWMAELLSALDRHDEAIAEVRRAEAIDPTMIIRWNVGRVLYFAGRYEEAIAHLIGFIASTDQYLDAATGYLMFAYFALDDFDAMADDMESLAPALADSLRKGSVEERRAFAARFADASVGGPDAIGGGPPAALFQALFWTRVSTDSALSRLSRMAEDPTDARSRVAWFEMLADSSFDVLRDDPRYRQLDARFRP